MKSQLSYFFALLLVVNVSCSDDEETRKGDPDLTHTGEQWNVASVEYTLIDQSASGTVGQTFKTGSKENAGTFYFVDGFDAGDRGSFELNVEGYNKEDVFSFSNDAGSVNVFEIEQSVGAQTNQNIVVLSGSAEAGEMTLGGSIIKQSTSGQFSLQLEMVLVKK